ncbi:MAG: hypothetical protein LBV18_04070 [Alistipes sp.]|jgi:hypothetical protein|nr:hypothetical protein [Alistipes sp.]
MLKIYSQTGQLKATIEPSDNSTQYEGVMEESVLNLSFTLPEFLRLDVNDYIDFLGKRYALFEDYRPEHLSDQQFKFDVKFYGPEKWLERAQVLATVNVDDAGNFALTDTALVHLQLYVENLNRITNSKAWVVGEVADSDNIVIEYSGKSCLAAIGELAEKVGTEWWIEGYTVNLSRCEHSGSIVMGYRHGLVNLSKELDEKTPFFTRLYPIGTTRNIDRGEYGHQRLQLPGGAKFIEKNTQYGIFERSETEAFAHIYPRRIGRVGAVRSENVKDDNGNPYTIYYFKDPTLNFDPNDYEIAGLVKHIAFESGPLNGNDFEANYNSDTREFELITQFPYENMQLPGGSLIPEIGNQYILWNIRMPQEYITAAEQELLTAALAYIEKGAIDTAVYKGKTNYIDLDERGVGLVKGRRVLLVSEYYFEEGNRPSRITSITRKIARPNDADIECTYAVTPSKIAGMENDITKIQAALDERLNRDQLQVLRSWDSADPTEYNVFSSLRSRMEHLSRLYPDTAKGFINFLKGIAVGEDASFAGAVSSPEFISGFIGGKGWAVRLIEEMNAVGVKETKSVAEFDDVTVRRSLRVHTLVINQTRAENGNIVFSDGMRVDHVDAATGRIYLETDGGTLYNPFHADDCVLSQQFNGVPSAGSGLQISKQYEFVVTEAGIGEEGENRLDWITFDAFRGDLSDIEKGDVIVRVDNLTDPTRKGIIIMIANGVDAPHIDVVYGMKTDPSDAVKSRSGNLAGIVHPDFGQLRGFGHYAQNFYGVGSFQFRSGRQVETAVEIAEGLSRTTMQKTMSSLTEETNYLTNAAFTEEMAHWSGNNSVTPVTVGGRLLVHNRSLSAVKVHVAAVTDYGGRNMLRIKDSYVRQANGHIRKPEPYKEEVITTNEAGEGVTETKQRLPKLYLSFRMICREAGMLTVGFESNEQATGDELMPFITQNIAAGNDAEPVAYNFEGTWDGEGDFLLEFTGDGYIDQLAVTDRPLDDFKVQVSTRFEQTAERITMEGKRIDGLNQAIGTVGLEVDALQGTVTIYGKRIDNLDETIGTISLQVSELDSSLSVTAQKVSRIDGEVAGIKGQITQILSAGYITRPEGNTLWASKELENGNKIVSYINQTATTITIAAEKIKLEGVVTANNYFQINLDGSLTAKKVNVTSGIFTDVVIQGSLRCAFRDGYYSLGSSGGISVGTLGLQNNNHVVIPGAPGGWVNSIVVPWTSEYNGFRAIILNDDWGGSAAAGLISANAPAGKYFWEHGRPMSSLDISPKTGVEMIGLGEGSTFKGWIILNRFSTTNQTQSTGFPFTVMYAGAVTGSGSMRKRTGMYDGITSTKLGTGKYRVQFAKSFSDVDNYTVFLTCENSGVGRFASVTERTLTYFDVYTGDDASPNDSGFNFIVVNTHSW